MGTKQVGVKLVDLCVFMSKVTCRPQGWTSWETTALTDVTLFICLVFVLSLHSHSPQAVYRFYMFFYFPGDALPLKTLTQEGQFAADGNGDRMRLQEVEKPDVGFQRFVHGSFSFPHLGP